MKFKDEHTYRPLLVIMAAAILAAAILHTAPALSQPYSTHQSMPQGGPYTHQIMSASSRDGLNWTEDNIVLLQHASVPAAIITQHGNIRLYYVDASRIPETINCAESSDGGKSFKVLGCTIQNRSLEKALDPSIVLLPDGRYRLYYFCSGRRIEQNKPHSIFSAISTDGIHFIQEKEVFNRMDAVDPDVFFNGKEWVMLVFSRGTIIATSKTGLDFTYLKPMQPQHWGTTSPVKLPDGRFRLYAFSQRGARVVASFISTDGIHWTQEAGVRLRSPRGKQITDPYVVKLRDGTWKMFYKIEIDSTAQ